MAKCTLKKEGQDWQKLNVKDAWERPPPCAASEKMAGGVVGSEWHGRAVMMMMMMDRLPQRVSRPKDLWGTVWLLVDLRLFPLGDALPSSVANWAVDREVWRCHFTAPPSAWPLTPSSICSLLGMSKKKIDKGNWGSCWGLFWLVWLTSGAWISTKVLHLNVVNFPLSQKFLSRRRSMMLLIWRLKMLSEWENLKVATVCSLLLQEYGNHSSTD